MIIKQNRTYWLPDLPTIKYDRFLLTDGRLAYRGSIIRRKVKNVFGVYFHYGFIYGLDESGTFWVIENNIDGICCITLEAFLQGLPYSIYYVNTTGNHSIIMQRAMERVDVQYEARENNCEHFVNYAVFAKLESIQSKRTETFADLVISSLEVYSRISPGYNGILSIYSVLREHLKLPRIKELSDALEKMGASNAIQSIKVLDEAIMKYPEVTSTSKNQKLTYYFRSKRFVILDREKNCLIVKVDCNDNTIPILTEFNPSGLKGWIEIDVAKANHGFCLKLIKESYDSVLIPKAKRAKNSISDLASLNLSNAQRLNSFK